MLRIALIGAGRSAIAGHIPALHALHDLFQVAAVADKSPEALEDTGILLGIPPAHRFLDYREMLEFIQLDAVVITLPHIFHQEVALAALDQNLNIICERPLAISVTDAEEIIQQAERRKKQVIVFHNFLYYPPFREALRLISEGAIGEPFFVRCEGVTGGFGAGTASFHPEWHESPEIAGGGVWMDSGYHSAYLCVRLLGSPVDTISARITNFASNYPVDDTAIALMTHENGAVSSVQAAWSVPSGGQRVLEIYGSKGSISIDHEGYPLGIFDNETQIWSHPEIISEPDESFIDLYREIFNCLRFGAPSPVPHQDAIHTLQILNAGYRASNLNSVEPATTPEEPPEMRGRLAA